ncbi:putative selenate reductase subunit YgfK [Pleomorphochaeta sp. DL1XJH-081]|uniref:putative selenate reductase subunit YgfK n=1 Tax=Pleomorphochaeta sp. DL1XJH-081 TaxID=3409690 RepID=UPI003BB6A56C
MGDIMRPVPFEELINRIFSEYRQSESIFGIKEDQFCKPDPTKGITVFGQKCATPLGPAAGPHTQLAQNIVASYLVGGRFMELKTVQKMDTLEIEKPCIDARDEGYNVEWSTEYTLPKAHEEYVKAWILLHLIESLIEKKVVDKPSFIFNMSVGYDLAGIKTPKMQTFIDSMIDARKSEVFNSCIESLKAMLAEGAFLEGTVWEGLEKKLVSLPESISPNISPSLTISTMHGCPPQEIEAICTYMLTEKKLNTFVKLNPTLLGFDTVRAILDDLGYDYISLNRESFDHDLQYSDAVAMLHRLVDLAKKQQLGFGVKLTNTLGSVNDQGVLPGDEMYMSGRTLLPISTGVGALLSKEFDGALPISYSGGANAMTALDIFETGIRPITLATDMLKPGGYVRMKQMVEILEKDSHTWDAKKIDVAKLENLASDARKRSSVEKDFRGTDNVSVPGKLPLTDCYVAPCVQACPIHQNVPDYIYLVGKGRYADALEVIYDTNALPNLTGYICDHQCQYHCTRLDYEGTVQIREMKKIAAEQGFAEYIKRWEKPEGATVKAAVIGAGPAGLSAAYFLARAGFAVTVFEREANAGGVTRNVIPGFRFPESALQADIDFIAKHGVAFKFGVESSLVTVDALHGNGFEHLFYAIGAEVDNEIPLRGDRSRIRPSLEFLNAFRKDPSSLSLGKHVVVVGGGNTAMDSARAATRVEGVKKVSVLYRRTKKEMPADLEEFDNAVDEGVEFLFLTNPESYGDDGKLVCRKMELGEPDSSGRRRPVPTDETLSIDADTLITAIGEKVDGEKLSWFGVPLDAKGWPATDAATLETSVSGVYVLGDAQSGPSTVVRCIASARKAVEAAIDAVLGSMEDDGHEHHHDEDGCSCGHDHDHDGDDCCCSADDDDDDELTDEEIDGIEAEEDAFFSEIRAKKGKYVSAASLGSPIKAFAEREASRCLECSYICNKCVEVCPNRANVAIDMRFRNDLFEHPYQIVHLDAFCNECGNCATFCPWEGAPYLDKLTVFSRSDDFENSENTGFYSENGAVVVRIDGDTSKHTILSDGTLDGDLPEEVSSIIEEIIVNHAYLLGTVGE